MVTAILLFFGGFVCGVLGLIAYGAIRATRSDGWDDSNALNFIRLLSPCFMHPEDFAKMYYILREDKTSAGTTTPSIERERKNGGAVMLKVSNTWTIFG